jgi:transmembrane sensor
MAGDDIEVDRDLTLFERYLAHECTAEEAARVEEMTEGDPSRARLLRELTALKAAIRSLDDDWNADGLWRGLRARLDSPAAGRSTAPSASSPHATTPPAPNEPARHRITRWMWTVGRAAALIVLAVGATLTWRAFAARTWATAGAPAMRAYATQPGQQAVVQLLDGTRVMLSVSSTLLVPRDFGRAGRDVQLDGQAYFEVARDSTLPFRVRTGDVVTQVVGTKFGIRAYSTESRLEVVVASGKVRVARDSAAGRPPVPNAELGPGELARVMPAGEIRVERGADVDRYLSWRTGWLTFVDTPLPQILEELERWHGVRFTLADPSLASRVLTTPLKPGALQATLAVLEAALDVRAVQTDSGVRLEPRPTK